MEVIKFGGSSVANADNIEKVVKIITDKAKGQKVVVVVSALGGITDNLLQCGQLATEGDETYKELLQQAGSRHIDTIKDLIPVTQQSRILSLVKTQWNELEDICHGIFLLKEFRLQLKTGWLVMGNYYRLK